MSSTTAMKETFVERASNLDRVAANHQPGFAKVCCLVPARALPCGRLLQRHHLPQNAEPRLAELLSHIAMLEWITPKNLKVTPWLAGRVHLACPGHGRGNSGTVPPAVAFPRPRRSLDDAERLVLALAVAPTHACTVKGGLLLFLPHNPHLTIRVAHATQTWTPERVRHDVFPYLLPLQLATSAVEALEEGPDGKMEECERGQRANGRRSENGGERAAHRTNRRSAMTGVCATNWKTVAERRSVSLSSPRKCAALFAALLCIRNGRHLSVDDQGPAFLPVRTAANVGLPGG
ncbi:hypothetical protein B0T16DRAFT_200086 [Cercophora newfieldiana]|uniref:Uncharacterized protein n=1 Tax=Cercophora newfieldiana TaxID=92897 RepID=A0AA40CIW9_9PEZI|nr:hypothetical protein B0T16DRAFT_200086 [Cercophora newfieldiana]